jgi:guanylate kinase
MIEKFYSLPSLEQQLPTRKLVTELFEVLKELKLERVIDLEEFFTISSTTRKELIKLSLTTSNSLGDFYLTKAEEQELIEFQFQRVPVSDPLGTIVTISGPSGIGKDTIIRELLKRKSSLTKLVSVTTRTKRPGEVEGVDYHYIYSKEYEFLEKSGLLLDQFRSGINRYGVPASELRRREKQDILLNIAPPSIIIFKEKIPSTKSIVILPPGSSLSERESEIYYRLKQRGTESEEEINRRILDDKDNFKDIDSIADFVVISERDKVEKSIFDIFVLLQKIKVDQK